MKQYMLLGTDEFKAMTAMFERKNLGEAGRNSKVRIMKKNR